MTLWLMAGLVAATFVSEDAALLSAALLARSGSVSALTATAVVASGIWVGDAALFAAGRLARRWRPVDRWISRRWPPERLSRAASRLRHGVAASIFVSRLTPGTRLPLYVAAGLMAVPPYLFLLCTAAASLVWTAAVVFGTSWLA